MSGPFNSIKAALGYTGGMVDQLDQMITMLNRPHELRTHHEAWLIEQGMEPATARRTAETLTDRAAELQAALVAARRDVNILCRSYRNALRPRR